MKADKDDILDNQGFEYIDATSSGSKNREMHIEKTSRWGWSTWNYYIRYEITVGPMMDALTF